MKLSTISLITLGCLLPWVGFAASENTITSPTTVPNTQMMMQSDAIKNKADSEAFLLANKMKPGVVTLPDGLQYKVLTEGTGPQPKLTDTVTVNYEGSLIDGSVFDSSYKRKEPATFPVNGVIPGWVEALQLMKVGSTWELYIPSALAYGERGAPPIIGPNQALLFKVNLMNIAK